MSAALTDHANLTAASEGIGHVVLGRTARGDAEMQRTVFPLSAPQRDLLGALDGRRSLRQLVATQPTLQSGRLARDAARLLAFGLVKQLRGELPRDLVVSSMNLTMRLPAHAFRPTAGRDASGRESAAAAPAEPDRRSPARPWVTIALAAGTVLLIAFFSLR